MTSASCGFIGGAVFTVPYLVLLPIGSPVQEDFGSIRQQIVVLGKEMMFSAVAGGIGMIVLDSEWDGRGGVCGIVQGLLGPFVSFALMHVALKIVLWSVWVFVSKNPRIAVAP
ncbi:hypothetical protein BDZ94DRAFT_578353 [Collybia nuda]|uniref:Uncharacterized protein n=1 Tax=Collybia nuda TaxID=64659 RepID=A0A9P5YA36_9AGAR|nr:hypothetical protein BDZ94DRAFT_578353 [Collybia nuda]